MNRQYKRLPALLTALCLLLSLAGCGSGDPGSAEQLPALKIYAPMDLEGTNTLRVLKDPAFSALVEQQLGFRPELNMLPSGMDYNEVALLEISGILLTDDPSWLVPLAESRKLATIDAQTPDQEYGQYSNRTYGYVLEDPGCVPTDVTILANLEALRSLDIAHVPFTPDSMYEILTLLKERYRIPLAVSGMPTDAGFAPLLALFDMVPSGGREMYMQDTAVVYDKLSGDAAEYLAYLQLLYSQELIPVDVLELTQYSCAKLIAQNAAAIAVFTDDAYVALALQYAGENNRQLVQVTLPAEKELLESGIFSRIVGYVGKDSVSPEAAVRFFSLLQEAIRQLPPEAADPYPQLLGQYMLFADYPLRKADLDPREVSPTYVYWLYQKEYLDMTYLDTAYCKILLGEAELSELDAAALAWKDDSKLLNLIAGKYWAYIRDTE